jgi:hypothetical protein
MEPNAIISASTEHILMIPWLCCKVHHNMRTMTPNMAYDVLTMLEIPSHECNMLPRGGIELNSVKSPNMATCNVHVMNGK